VGELALLADTTRSASIRARRDSELLKLTREEFDRLMAEDARFTGELVRLMGVQLQRSRALEPPGPSATSVIALTPAFDGLPIDQIARGLAQELGAGGTVVRIDGPAETPFNPASEAELLERYEQENDHVLLVAAEVEHGPWRAFCLRHADRVALVGDDRPVPGELTEDNALKGCDLLLVGAAEVPGRVGEWLDALAPRAHHLLDHTGGLGASLGVTARRLAGRSVGLVLSGGGARAFAHIGAIEELLAAGIAIDRVGGCSMGAFIGGMLGLPISAVPGCSWTAAC
jgi:hypothetical protein